MDAVSALDRLGGMAGTTALLRLTTRRHLAAAVTSGEVLRLSRGRYGLADVVEARRKAVELSAVLVLRSAAAHYEWPMKWQPPKPELAVGTKRNLPTDRRAGVRIMWVDHHRRDVRDGVTTPIRTVIDCARHLPFDEALAIADSALRSRLVTRSELDAFAEHVRGAGADRVRRVLRHADGRAANPFESVLRAHCIEAGLQVVPQASVTLGDRTVHPDLVAREFPLVIEADSHTFHAGRNAFGRDCSRYNALVIAGWCVLRFTWEQVMLEPTYVARVLAEFLESRTAGQDKVGLGVPAPA